MSHGNNRGRADTTVFGGTESLRTSNRSPLRPDILCRIPRVWLPGFIHRSRRVCESSFGPDLGRDGSKGIVYRPVMLLYSNYGHVFLKLSLEDWVLLVARVAGTEPRCLDARLSKKRDIRCEVYNIFALGDGKHRHVLDTRFHKL